MSMVMTKQSFYVEIGRDIRSRIRRHHRHISSELRSSMIEHNLQRLKDDGNLSNRVWQVTRSENRAMDKLIHDTRDYWDSAKFSYGERFVDGIIAHHGVVVTTQLIADILNQYNSTEFHAMYYRFFYLMPDQKTVDSLNLAVDHLTYLGNFKQQQRVIEMTIEESRLLTGRYSNQLENEYNTACENEHLSMEFIYSLRLSSAEKEYLFRWYLNQYQLSINQAFKASIAV